MSEPGFSGCEDKPRSRRGVCVHYISRPVMSSLRKDESGAVRRGLTVEPEERGQ